MSPKGVTKVLFKLSEWSIKTTIRFWFKVFSLLGYYHKDITNFMISVWTFEFQNVNPDCWSQLDWHWQDCGMEKFN